MWCCAARKRRRPRWRRNRVSASWKKLWMGAGAGGVSFVIACGGSGQPTPASSTTAPPATSVAAPPAAAQSEPAPPADQTGGFDGAKAFDQVAQIVSFGADR